MNNEKNDKYKYSPADFKSDQEVKWCPGCGNHAILTSVVRALPQVAEALHYKHERFTFVSGIGCSSRSMIKVATPVVTNLWKERDMEGMRRISREMSLVNLIVGSFLFLLIWVNLDNIFSLMPGSYSDGRYVFLFLGLARVMDMYSGLNGTILVTSKKYRYDFTFSLMLVALTVASNALLIPRWGMTGAALATMITVLAYNAIRIASVWKFYRIQPFALSDLLVVALAAGCIGASALVPPMGHFIADGLIRSALVAALYGGAVYSLKLSPEINRTIDRTLSRLGIRLGRRA
jgi:O-antigen/teichoic acid export membrane protein